MTAAEAINHLRGRAAIAAEIEARAIVVEVEAINLTLASGLTRPAADRRGFGRRGR